MTTDEALDTMTRLNNWISIMQQEADNVAQDLRSLACGCMRYDPDYVSSLDLEVHDS